MLTFFYCFTKCSPSKDSSKYTYILRYAHTHRYSIKENIQMRNEEDIISELKIYKQLGGGTVCDLTSIGLR